MDSEQKTSKDLWFIHGKYYDLTPFIPTHPGGETILKMSKGLEDATPLMESYHAFANREYIYKTMENYLIDYVPSDAETRTKTETHYTFEQNGFYMTLTRKVRAHFGAHKDNESVTKNIKANKWWAFKVFTFTFLFLVCFSIGFLIPQIKNRIVRSIFATFAGSLLIMVGFNAMHDASHYAIGVRNSWENTLTLRLWNSVAMWDSAKWLYHHTVRHHSFTGDIHLDPDVVHAKPVIRKHLAEKPEEYIYFYTSKFMPDSILRNPITYMAHTFGYAAMLNFGQLVAYNFVWPVAGELWLLPLEKTKHMFQKYWWEYAISLFILGSLLYRMDIFPTFGFLIAASFSYGMCILADHDTYESAIENHMTGGSVDWGEIQVRHSADFAAAGMFSRLFGEVFGGINAQIGHHLYPSVNHVYLAELIPIIKETCQEFNIPYASHDTLLEALLSVSETLHATMGRGYERKKHE
jgi:linoleoyl-CoA desaturase